MKYVVSTIDSRPEYTEIASEGAVTVSCDYQGVETAEAGASVVVRMVAEYCREGDKDEAIIVVCARGDRGRDGQAGTSELGHIVPGDGWARLWGRLGSDLAVGESPCMGSRW